MHFQSSFKFSQNFGVALIFSVRLRELEFSKIQQSHPKFTICFSNFLRVVANFSNTLTSHEHILHVPFLLLYTNCMRIYYSWIHCFSKSRNFLVTLEKMIFREDEIRVKCIPT